MLSDDRADGGLRPVDRAGRSQSRGHLDERAKVRVGRERRVDCRGVGVEVEQEAHPAHGGRKVAEIVEEHGAGDVVGAGREFDDPAPVGQAQRATVAGRRRLLDPGYGPLSEEGQQCAGGERRAERQAEGNAALTGRRRSPTPAQLRGGCCEDLADRIVELADTSEPGGARDIDER